MKIDYEAIERIANCAIEQADKTELEAIRLAMAAHFARQMLTNIKQHGADRVLDRGVESQVQSIESAIEQVTSCKSISFQAEAGLIGLHAMLKVLKGEELQP